MTKSPCSSSLIHLGLVFYFFFSRHGAALGALWAQRRAGRLSDVQPHFFICVWSRAKVAAGLGWGPFGAIKEVCIIENPKCSPSSSHLSPELFQIESLKIKTNAIAVVPRQIVGSLFPPADVGGLCSFRVDVMALLLPSAPLEADYPQKCVFFFILFLKETGSVLSFI